MSRPEPAPASLAIPLRLAPAYAHCEHIARAHYENFPVASRLLSKAMRPHVAAVYAFARAADDFADEGTLAARERYHLLDDWLARVRRAAQGEVPADEHEQVFGAVAHTMAVCQLPLGLFEDLLSAFRQDVETRRYATWAGLMDYCRRSANPVGRLVLGIAGHRGEAVELASDCVCTALQLTNFWQDFAIDWRRGRLYVPADVHARLRAQEADLAGGAFTPQWREALRESSRRTRALFAAGRAVGDLVPGRLGLELRLTWLGGLRILDRIDAAGHDTWSARPALRKADVPVLLWQALRWSKAV